jgi:signal transduction histidine kinase
MKKKTLGDVEPKKRHDKVDRTARSHRELLTSNQKLCAEIDSLKRDKASLERECVRIQSLLAHLQELEEQERILIVHKMYEELGTLLAALKMDLNLMSEELSSQNPEIVEFRDVSNRHIDAALDELRRLSDELRPPLLDNLGLGAALEWQADLFHKQTGIYCDVKIVPEDIQVERNLSIGLFRILRGLLENVIHHSQAEYVKIGLKREEGRLELTVSDDGLGISDEKVSDPLSLGLNIMKERAKSLGGRMTIEGRKDKGTQVIVKVPL